MSAVAYIDKARDWARSLEEDEAERAGFDRVEDARPVVARKLGIAPGTLTSLRKNRLKSISAHNYDRLNQAAAHLIEKKLVRLQHELDLTRQQGLDARSNDYVATLEALVARARKDLGLIPDPNGEG
jgi:hypothetical protein